MPVFIPPNAETDATIIKEKAVAFLEAALPGWESQSGNLDDLILDFFSQVAGEQAEVLNEQLISLYRSFGPLVGTPPINAVAATANVTFTVQDETGYTIPEGTTVGIQDANGELQGFRLRAPLTVATAKLTGAGLCEATEPGTQANSLTGLCELISTPPFVISATLGTSGGGVDEEEDAIYLDRLTESLQIMKPGPVLAKDAAVVARSVAGVFRAAAVNLLKPAAADGGEGTEETNVEKCVTVACAMGDGTACTAEQLAAVAALIKGQREQNFKIFAIKPHFTEMDVTTTVFAWPGQELSVVKASVEAALKEALSPARWGTDESGNPSHWLNNPTVRQADLFEAVMNVAGVRWCSALTFAKHGEALGTANVTLGSGSAVPALPKPNTITVTVEPST